ncbi:hypothetical protein [Alloactinosynnema sp. L-07]|nr:hypothetical protein [Alloactinosynnema sp. L-07]
MMRLPLLSSAWSPATMNAWVEGRRGQALRKGLIRLVWPLAAMIVGVEWRPVRASRMELVPLLRLVRQQATMIAGSRGGPLG